MVLLFGVLACAEGPYQAPYDSTIHSSIESLTYVSNAAISEEDGFGPVVHFVTTVTRPDRFGRDLPLEDVEVNIFSYWPGAYILPEKAVKTVDDFLAACEAGQGDDEYQELCDLFKLDGGNDYYELTGEYALAVDDSAGDPGFRPNYLRGVTDTTGAVEWYLFLDSTPGADTDFGIEMSTNADITTTIVSTATQDSK
jgi:hypothetical protein